MQDCGFLPIEVMQLVAGQRVVRIVGQVRLRLLDGAGNDVQGLLHQVELVVIHRGGFIENVALHLDEMDLIADCVAGLAAAS